MWTKLRRLLKGNGIGALLLRASTGTFSVKVAGAGIAFLIQIWLARLLKVDDYGLYIYVLAWINFLVLFAKLGMDVVIIRYIPIYRNSSDWGLFRGLLHYSLRKVFWLSVFIGGLLCLVVLILHDQIGELQMHTFWVAALLLPVLAMTSLRNATLQGLKYVIRAQIPETIIRPLLLGALASLYFFYQSGQISALHAMVFNIIAAGISFMIGTYWLIQRLPEQVNGSRSDYNRSEWLKMSIPMFFIAGMNLLLHQTDIMMLGAIGGTDQAGIYGAASRISALVVFGLTAVNAIVAPMISELHASNQKQKLQRMITLSARGIFLFTAIVSLLLILFGTFFLGLFGAEFISGYQALVILLVGQAVSAIAGSVGFLMVMTGHQKSAAKIIGFSTLVNIVLNAGLIPIFGMIGAAISTALSAALWNLAMLFYVYRNININPTVFARLTHE